MATYNTNQGAVTSSQYDAMLSREYGYLTDSEKAEVARRNAKLAAKANAVESLSNDDWQDLRNRWNSAIRAAQASGRNPIQQLQDAEKATGVTRSQMLAGKAAHPEA